MKHKARWNKERNTQGKRARETGEGVVGHVSSEDEANLKRKREREGVNRALWLVEINGGGTVKSPLYHTVLVCTA